MIHESRSGLSDSGSSDLRDAYVCLLHGDRLEFFLYALVLGARLQALDPDRLRILLVGRRLHHHPSPRKRSQHCLEDLWHLHPIDLIDAPAADNTPRKRHRFVFSKLRAMALPVRKLLFLDLDILPRNSLAELFHLRPPAAMHHGQWSFSCTRSHGTYWPRRAYCGCPNAGVMVLKGNSSKFVKHLVSQVATIPNKAATSLPEQYFMARVMRHWKQISVAWNYEVHPSFFAAIEQSEWTSPGQWSYGGQCHLPAAWSKIGCCKHNLRSSVNLFHFSGNYLQPWWYLWLLSDDNFSMKEAETIIDLEFSETDPQGRIGLAVCEWLDAVLQARDLFSAGSDKWHHVSRSIECLAKQALKYRLQCPQCSRGVWALHQQPLYELSCTKGWAHCKGHIGANHTFLHKSNRRAHHTPHKFNGAEPTSQASSCCEQCFLESYHRWYLKA